MTDTCHNISEYLKSGCIKDKTLRQQIEHLCTWLFRLENVTELWDGTTIEQVLHMTEIHKIDMLMRLDRNPQKLHPLLSRDISFFVHAYISRREKPSKPTPYRNHLHI